MVNLEFVAGGYDLVEALRVDEQGRLYFSEMFRDGGVFRRNPDGRIELIVKGRTAVGGMAFREAGGLVLNGRGMALWNEKTAEVRDVFTQFEGTPILHLNDLTVRARRQYHHRLLGFSCCPIPTKWRNRWPLRFPSNFRPGACSGWTPREASASLTTASS